MKEMFMKTGECILEIEETLDLCDRLAKGSASDRARIPGLIQRVKTLREDGTSSNENRKKYAQALNESVNGAKPNGDAEYRKSFDKYLTGKIEEGTTEFRDF